MVPPPPLQPPEDWWDNKQMTLLFFILTQKGAGVDNFPAHWQMMFKDYPALGVNSCDCCLTPLLCAVCRKCMCMCVLMTQLCQTGLFSLHFFTKVPWSSLFYDHWFENNQNLYQLFIPLHYDFFPAIRVCFSPAILLSWLLSLLPIVTLYLHFQSFLLSLMLFFSTVSSLMETRFTSDNKCSCGVPHSS